MWVRQNRVISSSTKGTGSSPSTRKHLSCHTSLAVISISEPAFKAGDKENHSWCAAVDRDLVFVGEMLIKRGKENYKCRMSHQQNCLDHDDHQTLKSHRLLNVIGFTWVLNPQPLPLYTKSVFNLAEISYSVTFSDPEKGNLYSQLTRP